MSYTAPIKDMLFNMAHLADLNGLTQQAPAFADHGLETAQAVVEECAKLAEQRHRAAELGRRQEARPAGMPATS